MLLVPDVGSVERTQPLSSGQAPEETEALSNSAHGSKLYSHGSPEVFPGGEEQSSTTPSLGGFLTACIQNATPGKGTFFEVTTRCRALSLL